MRRRDLVSYGILALIVGVLAGLAWLTRHPESEVLDRVEAWPVLGEAARSFRRAYREPAPAGEPDIEWEYVVLRDEDEARRAGPPRQRRTWVSSGVPLRRRPDSRAPVVDHTSELAELAVVDRRGDWLRVRTEGRSEQGLEEGWVRLSPATPSDRPPLGEDPAPPLPLPGRSADPAYLKRGRELLGDDEIVGRVGPYRLYTDVQDRELIRRLDTVAGQVEAHYRARYRLPLRGEARESVMIFERAADYRVFRSTWPKLRRVESGGHTSHGLIALFRGSRPPRQVVGSLLHEILHLLNRRGLGPALPAWLDEGIADDLSRSAIDEEGRLVPGSFALTYEEVENRVWRYGGLAAIDRTARALRDGELLPLRALIDMPWEEFVDPDTSSLHYAQSAMWVRYLLDGEEGALAEGFRDYLAEIAAGGPAGAENLGRHLARTWPELELGFRLWIAGQDLKYRDPGGAGTFE